MAFNKDDRKNLKSLADSIDNKQVKIKLPTGNKDDNFEEEYHYDLMDMIVGLCGASMFGERNQKYSNLERLISKPLTWAKDVTNIKDSINDIKKTIKSISSSDSSTEIKKYIEEINKNNVNQKNQQETIDNVVDIKPVDTQIFIPYLTKIDEYLKQFVTSINDNNEATKQFYDQIIEKINKDNNKQHINNVIEVEPFDVQALSPYLTKIDEYLKQFITSINDNNKTTKQFYDQIIEKINKDNKQQSIIGIKPFDDKNIIEYLNLIKLYLSSIDNKIPDNISGLFQQKPVESSENNIVFPSTIDVNIKSIESSIFNPDEFKNAIVGAIQSSAPKAIIEFLIKSDKLTFNEINEFLKNINSSQLQNNVIKDFDQLGKTFTELNEIFKDVNVDNINEFVNAIKGLTPDDIQNFIDALLVDTSKLKNIDNLNNALKQIESLNKKLEIIGKSKPVVKLGFDVISEEAELIKNVVTKFGEIDSEKLKLTINTVNTFAKLMIVTSACLVLGSLIVSMVPITKIITFGLTLATLVASIAVPILLLDRYGKGEKNKIFQGAEQLSKIILVCGAVLALGAFIVQKVPAAQIFKFGIILAGFIITVTLPLLYLNKIEKQVLRGINSLNKLIISSAAVLLIGALFMYIPGMVQNVLGFGLLLASFILLVVGAYTLGATLTKKLAPDITALGEIIAYSAAALLIGGLFMYIPGMAKNVIKFGLLLAGFVLVVTAAYSIGARLLKNEIRDALQLGILIGASAAALMIGGLFMLIPGMPKAVLQFGLLLAGFIVVTTLAFGFVSLMMKKNRSIARDIAVLGVLIAIVSACMVFGPIFLKLAGVPYSDVALFAGMVILFIGYMGVIVLALSRIPKKELLAGTLTLVAIAGVILAMTYVINLIGETVTKYPMGVILEGMADIGILIGATFAVAALIGAAEVGSGGVFAGMVAAGLATILAVAGVLEVMNDIIVSIANSGILSIDIDSIIDQLDNEMKLLGAFGLYVLGVGALLAIPGLQLVLALGSIALGDISTLILITSIACVQLSKAINDVKGIDPKSMETLPNFISIFMFGKSGDQGMFGILDKISNPLTFAKFFTMGMPAIRQISSLVSEISEAIQSYANLKAPIYDASGKVTGYRQLNQSDFTEAATNVETILTTIGGAIINTYNNNSEIFNGTFMDNVRGLVPFYALMDSIGGKDTPFARVVTSFGPVATLITGLSEAIQNYANLTIKDPLTNKDRRMKDTDFTEAGKNIELVLTTIAQAISDVYYNNKELFDGSIIDKIQSFVPMLALINAANDKDTPFTRVVKSFMPVSTLISELGKSISEYASLSYTKYDSSGKGTTIQMNRDDFRSAGNNISLVLTTIGQAISDVYKNNKELFDGTILEQGVNTFLSFASPIYGLINAFGDKDTPFARVVKSFVPVATMLSEMGKAIEFYANMTFVEYKDGKETKVNITEEKLAKTSENIGKVMKIILRSICDVYNDNKDMFDGALLGLGDSPIQKVGNAMKPVSELIVNMAEAIKDYSSMKMPLFNETTGEIEKDKFKILKDTDFILASENIKTVIRLILDTMNDIVHDSKYSEYFDRPWYELGLGDTPADKVANAMKPTIELISLMSDILQQYAEMKMPKVVNGEFVEGKFVPLDFNKVMKNIDTVITTLFKSVDEAYRGKEDLFDTGFLKQSPVAKISKGMVPVIELLSNLSSVLQQYAEMKIPKMNPDGSIDEGKFAEIDFAKVSTNIGTIITTLFTAVDDAYKGKEKLIDAPLLGDSPINKIAQGLLPISEVLGNAAEAVILLASSIVPIYDKNGKITDKLTFESKNIPKAKDVIKQIIVTIFEGVNNAYTTLDNTVDFDDIEKINKYFGPTSKTLLNIATLIKSYSMMTIPYYDPEKKIFDKSKSTLLSNKDIINTGTTISLVLTAISTAILNTLNNSKNLKFGDIMKVTAILNPASKMISDIGKSLVEYASQKIPVKFDDKGNPIEWGSLGVTDISKATESIGQIINALGDAITKVGNDDVNGIFKSNFGQSTAGNVVNVISKLSKILNGLAITIYRYSKGEFPTFTFNDGKITEGATINLAEADFTAAQDRIAQVITAICNGIVEVYKDEELNSFITNTDKDELSKFNVLINSINSMSKMIENVSNAFKNLQTTFESNNFDPSDVLNNIKTLLRKTAGLDKGTGLQQIIDTITEVNNFLDPASKIVTDEISKMNNTNDWTDAVKHGAKALVNSGLNGLGLGEKTGDEKTSFATSSITTIITQIENLLSSISIIEKIKIPKQKTITENISQINILLESINKKDDNNSLINVFKNIQKFELNGSIEEQVNNLKYVLTTANQISSLLKTFNNQQLNPDDYYSNIQNIRYILIGNDKTKDQYGLIDIFEAFYQITDKMKEKTNDLLDIKTIFESLGTLSNNLQVWGVVISKINQDKEAISGGAKTFVDNLQKLSTLGDGNVLLNLAAIHSTLKNILEDDTLSKWRIEITKYDDETILSGATKFSSNIETVFKAIEQNITNTKNKQFKDHTDTLQKYVESINSINITKITYLTNLVNSMLKLSNSIKGIDKLNETIANKLSMVLKNLIAQLKEAQATIKTADEMHEKRKKLIEENVKVIKGLMEKDMNIIVHSDQENTLTETSDATTTTTTGGTTTTDNNGGQGTKGSQGGTARDGGRGDAKEAGKKMNGQNGGQSPK